MSAKRPAILGGAPLRSARFAPRRTMGAAERRAALEVLDSDVLSAFLGGPGPLFLGGPRVRELEARWAERYGFRHAVSVNSWTSGLVTCIGACGIGPGDEVICSPFTMSASATCALFYGGIPIFADVDPHTFCLDPASVESRITSRTRAIVVVHLFGHPAEMDALLAIAKRHDLFVIEDAAQAPGTHYRGQPVGALGDLGGFSLNYHKHVHAGEGGVIVTHDDQLALRCQLIRNHGENAVDALGVADLTNVIGHNFRLTELQAAIATAQLARLDGYLAHRQRLARHLHARIAALPGLSSHPPPADCTHAYYVFPLLYDAEVTGLSRDLFVRAVAQELPATDDFEQTPLVAGYVRPLYLSRIYQERAGLAHGHPFNANPGVTYHYPRGLCPVAERLHERELLLTPLVREPLTEDDIDDLADAMEKVLTQADTLRGLDAARDT